MPDTRQGFNPVQTQDFAPTFDQVAAQQRAIESQQDTQKMMGLALEDTQSLAGGKRVYDRYMKDFEPDPNFSIGEDQKKALRLEFGDEQSKEIMDGVNSQGELDSKAGYNREDMKRKQDLAAYGGTGIAASLVSSVLDPVGWAMSIASGPLGGGAKVTQIARIGRMAAIAGVENAALEAALVAGDTQLDGKHIFYAGLAGGIMGGTIGAATRIRAKGEPGPLDEIVPEGGTRGGTPGDSDLDMVVQGADDFDAATTRMGQDAMDYDAWLAARADPSIQGRDASDYSSWLERNADPEAQGTDLRNYDTWLEQNTRNQDVELSASIDIADHIDDLRSAANLRPTRIDHANVKSAIADEEANLANLRQQQIDARAEAAAQRGAPHNSDEALNLKVSQGVAGRQFDDAIAASQRRLDELHGTKKKQDGVGAAKEELKRFTSLTREQQAKEIGAGRGVEESDMGDALKRAFSENEGKATERIMTKILREEAERLSSTAGQADSVKLPETDLKGYGPANVDDSVGAARVQGSSVSGEDFPMTQSMEDLTEQLAEEARRSNVMPKKLPGKVWSVASYILTSKNPVMRGLGLRFLENPQGGGFASKTASILSDVNNNIIRHAEGNRMNDGWDMWLKEQGLSPLEYLKTANVERFNNEVFSAIAKGIPDGTPPSVKLAAEGIADKLQKGLELRKAAGESGFEHVKSARDYIPILFDGPKIASSVAKFGNERVVQLLSKGYQSGRYGLGKKSADAIADMQVRRAMDSTLTSRMSFEKVVSQADRAAFIEGLKKAGVPDHVIDDFIEGQDLADIASSISNRARASMGINTQAQLDGMTVQDMLKTNVSEIADNYGKEAAAGAAMARMGFTTRAQVMEAIDAAERVGRNMGLPAGQVSDEANQLRDAVKLIYGNTLDDDPTSGMVRATRRAREVTTITRLNQMSFAQFSEAARGLVKMGLGTILKSIPATSFLRSRKARVGGKAHQPLKEPELREIEENLGYIGEDNWLTGWATRHEEFGESPETINKVSGLLDKALALGSRANIVLSGFKAVQGGMEKVMVRAIAKRLKEHLSGGRVLPKRDLDEIGLSEDVMKRLKRHFDDNPRWDDYNGNKVRMLNFDAMEPDLKEITAMAIRRMQGRLVQRHFVGDEGIWMHKWWGKAISQFKGFSIVSMEKQLIHDVRGDKLQAAQIFAWSTFLGLIAYSTQMGMQSVGRADRDKFLDEKFSDQNMAYGVFNKLPQVASLGLGADAMGTLGLLPKSLSQAPGRTGYNQMDAGSIVPAIGMMGDYAKFISKASDYATGADDVSTREVVGNFMRLVPLANAIGIGQAVKASVDILEDE